MAHFPLAEVNVFSDAPFKGNPVAVIHDADGIPDEVMQAVATWLNVSVTAYLLTPTVDGADYRLRMFRPGGELPFAGYPTLGACHSWLEAGGSPRGDDIVQECAEGLVHVRRTPSGLAFQAPKLARSGPLDDAALSAMVAGLGLSRDAVVDHQWCDNGPDWRVLLLEDATAVLAIEPDHQALAEMFIGVVAPRAEGEADFEVRGFVPAPSGLVEDPVTGSLHAGIAQWLMSSGRAPDHYVASQGSRVGHQGRVTIARHSDGVWVAGACTTVVSGSIRLER